MKVWAGTQYECVLREVNTDQIPDPLWGSTAISCSRCALNLKLPVKVSATERDIERRDK